MKRTFPLSYYSSRAISTERTSRCRRIWVGHGLWNGCVWTRKARLPCTFDRTTISCSILSKRNRPTFSHRAAKQQVQTTQQPGNIFQTDRSSSGRPPWNAFQTLCSKHSGEMSRFADERTTTRTVFWTDFTNLQLTTEIHCAIAYHRNDHNVAPVYDPRGVPTGKRFAFVSRARVLVISAAAFVIVYTSECDTSR